MVFGPDPFFLARRQWSVEETQETEQNVNVDVEDNTDLYSYSDHGLVEAIGRNATRRGTVGDICVRLRNLGCHLVQVPFPPSSFDVLSHRRPSPHTLSYFTQSSSSSSRHHVFQS